MFSVLMDPKLATYSSRETLVAKPEIPEFHYLPDRNMVLNRSGLLREINSHFDFDHWPTLTVDMVQPIKK